MSDLTLEVSAKVHQPRILLYHDTFEGETGYRMNILGTPVSVFINEADGDKMARYMLFKTPDPDVEPNQETVFAPAYSEPAKE